jgi:hypothetical protein
LVLLEAPEKARICHCQKNLAGARPTLLAWGKDETVPFLLLCVGVLALVTGLAMVGFGIPINEFSFGNTLIMAGTTAAVGGLVIIGLGMVVRQLRRLAEVLEARSPARFGQPAEDFEGAAVPPPTVPAQSRMPFPPRPKPDPHAEQTAAVAAALAEDRGESFVPTLRNPDEQALRVDDDISVSPRQPAGAPAGAAVTGLSRPATAQSLGVSERSEPVSSWRASPLPTPPVAPPPLPQARSPQPPNFDAMWPAESKLPIAPTLGEPKADVLPRDPLASAAERPEPEKPHAVAILKSGVVDGMGYTLYVDGSIEAELPQGTLRFASINELRSHLEKHS